MKAFISTLLGYDPNQKNLEGGILGVVKAYYGCVEAQGRGTLHCHMLVWVEGGLNPNEIKKRALGNDPSDAEFGKRLLAFLDDTISNSVPKEPAPNINVPSDTHHPCSVRGIPVSTDEPLFSASRQKDLRNVVSRCQAHDHSATCFKYWRGPPEPKTCRFDLHEENFRAESSFDPETGEINLQCLDGLVNNFNATIIEAIRCNMDIKFIGSGASAKAILYYITDYITKSQLKTHIAFSMLELAVKKLGEFNPHEDDLTIHAKKMLQKCAYAMISQQELSAQQVASYLLDLEDHFTSHSYRNFYWTAFENFIEQESPSPECYTSKTAVSPTENNEDKSNSDSDTDSDSEDDSDSEAGFAFDDIDPQMIADQTTNTNDDDEIRVSTDGMGKLVPMGSQLADYHLRGIELNCVCAWDFISRIDRVSKSSDRRKHQAKSSSEDNENMDVDMYDDAADEDPTELDQTSDATMDSTAYKRPRVPFLKGHDQEKNSYSSCSCS
ncbi:hypothetical protein C8J57DRAFT_1060476 [Mycena rebaudengoi]|nr:hypothetical protein C8J57DRAFT_1060476 [Mycena rebaudengoi]